MSNHLAVAAVSASLAHMLRGPVQADVDGALVFTDRPATTDGTTNGPEVRIFLYGVYPNPSWRNQDLPTRSPDGHLMTLPQAAINLHYLISFHGDERSLEPQRLLGSVVRQLHSYPVLNRGQITAMVNAMSGNGNGNPLAATDLADQPELVRFTPKLLDLEEMSKLWSVFFQTSYQLSVTYEASVVLISPDETPRSALPVRDAHLVATTIRRPVIERVEAVTGLRDPISSGTTIRIRGNQLRGEITIVWIGTERVDPESPEITDREIQLEVPDTVRAGLTGLRVEHRRLLGEPPTERPAGESNIGPVIVRPRIRQDENDNYEISITDVVEDGEQRSGTLHVTLDPAVGKRQRVIVYLNQIGQPPEQPANSYSFNFESRDQEDQDDETSDQTVAFSGVVTGIYLVRLSVDGAESTLVMDSDDSSPTFEQYIEPRIEIP
jgi:hypothetical protein